MPTQTKQTKPLPATEANGIKAIIFLQSMAGITETRAKAKAGWRGMNQHAKEHTLRVYLLLS